MSSTQGPDEANEGRRRADEQDGSLVGGQSRQSPERPITVTLDMTDDRTGEASTAAPQELVHEDEPVGRGFGGVFVLFDKP